MAGGAGEEHWVVVKDGEVDLGFYARETDDGVYLTDITEKGVFHRSKIPAGKWLSVGKTPVYTLDDVRHTLPRLLASGVRCFPVRIIPTPVLVKAKKAEWMNQKLHPGREVIDHPMRPRLVRFLKHYNPEKLLVVDEMLRGALGDEERFFALLVKRYGPEPTVALTKAEYHALRARLTRFYDHHNPAKLGEIDGLLKKYGHDEGLLFNVLIAKYGPEPSDRAQAVLKHLPPPAGAAAHMEHVKVQSGGYVNTLADGSLAAPPPEHAHRMPRDGDADAFPLPSPERGGVLVDRMGAVLSPDQAGGADAHGLVRPRRGVQRRVNPAGVRVLEISNRAVLLRRYYDALLEHTWWAQNRRALIDLAAEGRGELLKAQFRNQELQDQIAVLEAQLACDDDDDDTTTTVDTEMASVPSPRRRSRLGLQQLASPTRPTGSEMERDVSSLEGGVPPLHAAALAVAGDDAHHPQGQYPQVQQQSLAGTGSLSTSSRAPSAVPHPQQSQLSHGPPPSDPVAAAPPVDDELALAKHIAAHAQDTGLNTDTGTASATVGVESQAPPGTGPPSVAPASRQASIVRIQSAAVSVVDERGPGGDGETAPPAAGTPPDHSFFSGVHNAPATMPILGEVPRVESVVPAEAGATTDSGAGSTPSPPRVRMPAGEDPDPRATPGAAGVPRPGAVTTPPPPPPDNERPRVVSRAVSAMSTFAAPHHISQRVHDIVDGLFAVPQPHPALAAPPPPPPVTSVNMGRPNHAPAPDDFCDFGPLQTSVNFPPGAAADTSAGNVHALAPQLSVFGGAGGDDGRRPAPLMRPPSPSAHGDPHAGGAAAPRTPASHGDASSFNLTRNILTPRAPPPSQPALAAGLARAAGDVPPPLNYYNAAVADDAPHAARPPQRIDSVHLYLDPPPPLAMETPGAYRGQPGATVGGGAPYPTGAGVPGYYGVPAVAAVPPRLTAWEKDAIVADLVQEIRDAIRPGLQQGKEGRRRRRRKEG